MRAIEMSQLSLASPWIDLPHADELREMSRMLDEDMELAKRVQEDLVRDRSAHRGRTTAGGHRTLTLGLTA